MRWALVIDIEDTLKSFGPRHTLMTINRWWLNILNTVFLAVALASASAKPHLPPASILSQYCDVVQLFFTTQLSGFLHFSHLSFILIRARVAQI
jgi:hypothetical protein